MARLPGHLRHLVDRIRENREAHRSLYMLARECRRADIPPNTAVSILKSCAARVTERRIPHREIDSAVRYAYSAPEERRPAWPRPDPQAFARLTADSEGCLEELRRRSPVDVTAMSGDPAQVLTWLYRPHDLICVGRTRSEADTRPLRDHLATGLRDAQFLVPSPMRAIQGLTKEGQPSARCEDNTGPRRFLVVEFDEATLDQQAAVALRDILPVRLVMVVHTAGKSLHAWYPVAGLSEDFARSIFARRVALGADRATWTRCQYVRMPFGHRPGRGRQDVLYFDPRT